MKSRSASRSSTVSSTRYSTRTASLESKIFGDDFNELRRIAKEIAEVLETVPGTADVAVDPRPPLAQVAIKVDREAAARYGINVADIADLIQTGIGGIAVSQVFIGERRYDVTVRFPQDTRDSPEAIGRLLLTSSAGALVPLAQVANIRLQTGESTISRDMNHRFALVKLNYEDRSVPALIAEAKKAIADKVRFDPMRYRIEWGGQFESEQRAEARFGLIFGLMIGLMIVLLYAEFAALRHVALILGVVPLATLGGLIALHTTGVTLNVASAVGFIALFGVAVMNGVIMVANLNRSRDHEDSLIDAVVAGASERLRPVLMTATVATVGMLPAALATGIGSDVQRSLATVVAGGLLMATLLTLFLLPTFYFVIERQGARRTQTADLDVQLRELWQRRGMTVIFVTHSVSEAAFLANRAVVLGAKRRSDQAGPQIGIAHCSQQRTARRSQTGARDAALARSDRRMKKTLLPPLIPFVLLTLIAEFLVREGFVRRLSGAGAFRGFPRDDRQPRGVGPGSVLHLGRLAGWICHERADGDRDRSVVVLLARRAKSVLSLRDFLPDRAPHRGRAPAGDLVRIRHPDRNRLGLCGIRVSRDRQHAERNSFHRPAVARFVQALRGIAAGHAVQVAPSRGAAAGVYRTSRIRRTRGDRRHRGRIYRRWRTRFCSGDRPYAAAHR